MHVEYSIDSTDIITSVGGDWDTFARQGDAEQLVGDAVVGRNLNDYIYGEDTREIFHTIYERVRSSDRAIRIPFRCDTSARRMELELHIAPMRNNALFFRTRVLKAEDREPVDLPGVAVSGTETVIQMCSWCKRVKISPELWVEVEKAVDAMNIFRRHTEVGLEHTICPDCTNKIDQTVN